MWMTPLYADITHLFFRLQLSRFDVFLLLLSIHPCQRTDQKQKKNISLYTFQRWFFLLWEKVWKKETKTGLQTLKSNKLNVFFFKLRSHTSIGLVYDRLPKISLEEQEEYTLTLMNTRDTQYMLTLWFTINLCEGVESQKKNIIVCLFSTKRDAFRNIKIGIIVTCLL